MGFRVSRSPTTGTMYPMMIKFENWRFEGDDLRKNLKKEWNGLLRLISSVVMWIRSASLAQSFNIDPSSISLIVIESIKVVMKISWWVWIGSIIKLTHLAHLDLFEITDCIYFWNHYSIPWRDACEWKEASSELLIDWDRQTQSQVTDHHLISLDSLWTHRQHSARIIRSCDWTWG